MKYALLLTLLTSLNFAFAIEIHEIWEPQLPEKNYLILSTDGQIHELSALNTEALATLYTAIFESSEVELTFAQDNTKSFDEENRQEIVDVKILDNFELGLKDRVIVDTRTGNVRIERNTSNTRIGRNVRVGRPARTQRPSTVAPDPLSNYWPSQIQDMQEATEYFNTMNKDARESSQCYNRAHVWTYELFKNYNVMSTKIWIFFTKKYIREFRYKWWFHVTPAVHVEGEEEVITMDRKYMDGPRNLTYWKNFFIQNSARCPKVTIYSSYRGNQDLNYCYIIESNMYFWQPFHIENLERRNSALRLEWVTSELRVAYRNGFGSRF